MDDGGHRGQRGRGREQGGRQGPRRRRGHDLLRHRVLLSVLLVCAGLARTENFGLLEDSSSSEDATVQLYSNRTGSSSSSSRPSLSLLPRYKRATRETNDDGEECVPPAVDEFPDDFMSAEQREKGGIAAHFAIACYLILVLGVVCDDFFVPVLEVLCTRLDLAPDVAGATFMAAGTSSPEFFANVMGTFVTETDLGIGTIVGSAVFNIFGVISVCGLFAGKKIPLDWYPITRDCVIYGATVIVLFGVLQDEKVWWWESLMMVLFYLLYIVIMIFNPTIERWSHRTQQKIQRKIFPTQPTESTPLHHNHHGHMNGGSNGTAVVAGNMSGPAIVSSASTVSTASKSVQVSVPPLAAQESINDSVDAASVDIADGDDDEEDVRYPWQPPDSGGLKAVLEWIWWIVLFPANMLFFLTIPDVRRGPCCAKFFPLSFLLCISWIGGISYVLTWMITVIGFTLHIPDSVMGLTFLAVGTSIPEVISSLIVSKQGKGGMAISNSIGSNTFDILLCLGLPWFIKALMDGTTEGNSSEYLIEVQSEGLAYTVISLFVSLVVLYLILVASRFVLSRTLGFVSMGIYAVFITVSILFEMNVFFEVNPPMCDSDY